MFKNSFNSFHSFTDYLSKLPKITLGIDDLKEKAERIFKHESINTKKMWEIYVRNQTGDVSLNEIEFANKQAFILLSMAGLGILTFLPGSAFFLPVIVHIAKQNGINLIPESVSREFR